MRTLKTLAALAAAEKAREEAENGGANGGADGEGGQAVTMTNGERNSERLKVGFIKSYFFGVSFYLIAAGVIFLVSDLFWSEEAMRHINWDWPPLLIVTGIALYFVQRRKLRFRTLGTPADLERFKTEVREIMAADGWDIDYDNEQFMRAVCRRRDGIYSFFYTDTVTLRFRGSAVLYCVINDPTGRSKDFACMFSPCRRGRRLITKIGERLDGDGGDNATTVNRASRRQSDEKKKEI